MFIFDYIFVQFFGKFAVKFDFGAILFYCESECTTDVRVFFFWFFRQRDAVKKANKLKFIEKQNDSEFCNEAMNATS